MGRHSNKPVGGITETLGTGESLDILTAFDAVNKLPLTAKIGIISEKNTAMEIVEM